MIQQPDKPLTPLELFQRGIEMTRAIRGRVEESRAYYLGRSSRAPGQSLSEVFDPMRGPILKYFIETVRTINRTRNRRTDGAHHHNNRRTLLYYSGHTTSTSNFNPLVRYRKVLQNKPAAIPYFRLKIQVQWSDLFLDF